MSRSMAPMDDLDLALDVARAGAGVVDRWAGRTDGADFKGAVDPVTQADREAEQAMRDLLARARPNDAVLGEEEGGAKGARTWIIDPLDGTVNFLHGVPHVAVLVALADGDGVEVGVVHDVSRGEVTHARRGAGAWVDDRRISTSDQTVLGAALMATGFPYDRRDHAHEYGAMLAAALEHVQGVRRAGTAGLDLAWTAMGRYDGYWELGLKPWDMAAGSLIVEEAGGKVSDVRGRPLDVFNATSIVATTAALHQPLLDVLNPFVPARY